MAEVFHVVIPARYQSSRLPGKPLADIHGRPMVVRVAERASQAGAEEVIVATDDERIQRAVTDAGYEVLMTRADHRSGSDRVMEVADIRGWSDRAIVVNVQGDEPLIPPAVIRQLADYLKGDPQAAAATLCEPLLDQEAAADANAVKVVCSADGSALYFSRACIPFDRDGQGAVRGWLRHVGIYGFRVASLREFVALPPGELEVRESLEQLRLLENGIPLHVARSCEPVPGGVDTPTDLDRIRLAYDPAVSP